MPKGWIKRDYGGQPPGGSNWSSSMPIGGGSRRRGFVNLPANHGAANHPFYRQFIQQATNPGPGSQQASSNNLNDPRFSRSKSLRELIKERMDEQKECLRWMEYFLSPLSDMADSAIGELEDEKKAKKLKKGPGDKQIDGATVARIQRDAETAAAYGGMPMTGAGEGKVPDPNQPLAVGKVASKAKRWRDPVGRFQELQIEILALQRHALPPTAEEAQEFMAYFNQGLTEPMEARFKTMARIVGKGSGSDAKKAMEKPDGVGAESDEESGDSEDSSPLLPPRTRPGAATPKVEPAPVTPSVASSAASSVLGTPVSRRPTAPRANMPPPQQQMPPQSPPINSTPPRPPAQGPPMQPLPGMPPQGLHMQPRQGFPSQPPFQNGPTLGIPGPPKPGQDPTGPPSNFKPQQVQQPPQGPPPGSNPQQVQQPPQGPPPGSNPQQVQQPPQGPPPGSNPQQVQQPPQGPPPGFNPQQVQQPPQSPPGPRPGTMGGQPGMPPAGFRGGSAGGSGS